jgi:hypothetical protein
MIRSEAAFAADGLRLRKHVGDRHRQLLDLLGRPDLEGDLGAADEGGEQHRQQQGSLDRRHAAVVTPEIEESSFHRHLLNTARS